MIELDMVDIILHTLAITIANKIYLKERTPIDKKCALHMVIERSREMNRLK